MICFGREEIMDHLDEINIESLINNPEECGYRVMLREFFQYDVPLACPYKAMLQAFYEKIKGKENDKESGF